LGGGFRLSHGIFLRYGLCRFHGLCRVYRPCRFRGRSGFLLGDRLFRGGCDRLRRRFRFGIATPTEEESGHTETGL